MERKGKVVQREVTLELTEKQVQERQVQAMKLDLERAEVLEVLTKETDAWKLRKGELKNQAEKLEEERLRLNKEAEEKKATVTEEVLAVANFESCAMEYYHPAKPKKGEEQKLVDTRTLEPDERQAKLIEEQADTVNAGGQEVEDEE